RAGLRLDPGDELNHRFLGGLLYEMGRDTEAADSFRRAIEVQPNSYPAYRGLALALRRQGQFRESLAAWQRWHELGSKRPDWTEPSAEVVRYNEKLAGLDPVRLAAVLAGEVKLTDPAVLVALAQWCQAMKQMHATAFRY